MNTILVPIDFSPITDAVVSTAVRFARSLDAGITLMYTVRPPALLSEYSIEVERLATEEERQAEKELSDRRSALQGEGLAVDVVQTYGSPVLDIVKEAERRRPLMIVMGSRGHTTLYDLVVGSTTNGVLKHASCPVLVLPPSVNLTRLGAPLGAAAAGN